MPADNYTWTSLHHELDRWSKSGKTANFWWRDDDAVEETAQLQKLDALSRETRVPVSVAVIPAGLKASLVQFLNHRDNFIVLQHGYSHSSYAIEGAKKIELGGERLTSEIEAELITGRRQLSTELEIVSCRYWFHPGTASSLELILHWLMSALPVYRRCGREKPLIRPLGYCR